MRRYLALLYAVLCYLAFFGTFLYAIWFIWTMDDPHAWVTWQRAVPINAALLALFAVQHSVMARQWFKRAWTKLVPRAVERSTYVLAASLVLFVVVRFWQPVDGVVWELESSAAKMVLHGLFWFGFLLLFYSTYLIDHFDLFGLKQAWLYFQSRPYEPPKFRTPGPYRFVRHPLYLGFVIGFWSTPRMTGGHLFFAVMTTAYILLAIQFEERDLVDYHGEKYKIYRSGVSMLVPWTSKRKNS